MFRKYSKQRFRFWGNTVCNASHTFCEVSKLWQMYFRGVSGFFHFATFPRFPGSSCSTDSVSRKHVSQRCGVASTFRNVVFLLKHVAQRFRCVVNTIRNETFASLFHADTFQYIAFPVCRETCAKHERAPNLVCRETRGFWVGSGRARSGRVGGSGGSGVFFCAAAIFIKKH